MAASGILVDAVNACKTALTALGLVPITDPRNARPPCILVEPPSITANQNKTLAQLEFPITILGIPPGNKDTVQAHAGTVTRILVKFAEYTGDTVWHCHILEHEEHDMMRPLVGN